VKNLTTAIFSKAAGSGFSTAIGGRFYKGRAPQGVTWPYAIYFVVTDMPADTFTERLEDCVVQFSVFSKASGTTEILDAVAALQALYDYCNLTITGNALLYMQRTSGDGDPRSVFDDTEGGEGLYWQLDVDYSVLMKRN
jgi:hypothetical protein